MIVHCIAPRETVTKAGGTKGTGNCGSHCAVGEMDVKGKWEKNLKGIMWQRKKYWKAIFTCLSCEEVWQKWKRFFSSRFGKVLVMIKWETLKPKSKHLFTVDRHLLTWVWKWVSARAEDKLINKQSYTFRRLLQTTAVCGCAFFFSLRVIKAGIWTFSHYSWNLRRAVIGKMGQREWDMESDRGKKDDELVDAYYVYRWT